MAGAEDGITPFKQGVRYATFDLGGLRVHVPADQAAQLAPVAARAQAIYQRMCDDAGYHPTRTLHLVLTDDEDGHNGFSTVVPFDLINVQLGPTRPESTLFAGEDETARTIEHELAHHLSNDQNHGGRGVLESIFGRVMPNDPLSLLVFLAATPQHVTSPAFWHEGFAQWAETHYADPGSAWRGRGRDSLTHMVWRLDAAGGMIPPADDWRLSYVHWPYGNRAYLYGLAYTRWLAGAFAGRRGMWQIVDAQGRQVFPFSFTGGAEPVLGTDHDGLIAEARGALLAEEQRNLAHIRAQPVTQPERLTPADWRWSAPAWGGASELIAAGDTPTGSPALYRVGLGQVPAARQGVGASAWSLGNLRRIGDGAAVYAEAPTGNDTWSRSRVRIVQGGGVHDLPGERLLQPDARQSGPGWDVAAVQWLPAAQSRLVLARAATASVADWAAIPTQGHPWSPAFRPGHDEIAWVETDRDGSRLVLADLAGNGRRILWQVRGRILHPVWDAAGERLFCASDASGVANGWCVPLAGVPRPVTNTIGGILALVPSPDGSRFAVLEHDAGGPFLAVIPADPAAWPAALPQVDLAWPAPVAAHAPGAGAAAVQDRPDPVGPPPPAGGPAPEAHPYGGLAELRPRFWTPTTMVVPEGGIGVVAVATDALLTHQVVASVGEGFHEHTPIGLAAWIYSGWNPEIGLVARRAEVMYDQQILASDGNLYNYVEHLDDAEARVGYGMSGNARRWHGWLGAGIERRNGIERSTESYAGLDIANPKPFTGSEHYSELTLAYDDSLLFPTSYAREDGTAFSAQYRVGDERGSSAVFNGAYTFSAIPAWGHQAVIGGTWGWSDGPHDLQGRFGIGGNVAMGWPRGYPETMARGRCLDAGSVAWRMPLLRPFSGAGTSPWTTRQLVLETFYDIGRVGDDSLLTGGSRAGIPWFRSAGGELHLDVEFWALRLDPGLGMVHQLNGDHDTITYLTLGFRW